MFINVAQATLSILVLVSSALSDSLISDEEYQKLPPIFHIDDYAKCLNENKEFCKVKIKLLPLNPRNPSEIWKLIEKTRISKRHYNHDELHHAICANNYFPEFDANKSDAKLVFEKIYGDLYKNLGLKANISEVDCKDYRDSFKIAFYDYLLLFIVVLYLSFTIIATIYDVKHTKISAYHKYILILSLRHNLKKFLKSYENMMTSKLKCIQGFRFYTTLLIIFCHTFGSFIGGYIYNTEYLEEIPENIIRVCLRNLFVFLVQIFFLVSAWLLSYHAFQIFNKKSKQIHVVKFALLTFFNRYLRILPPLLFMVALGRSAWVYSTFYGPIKEIFADAEYKRCLKNWWTNLLLINNHFNKENMCYFITWYLSADTQLYALSILLLIVIWRFPGNLEKVFGLTLTVAILIPAVVSYINSLDIIYRITPENARYNMFFSFDFSATYSSTYCNMATYTLGLIFGYIYYKYENTPIFTSKPRKILWWIIFIGFPLSTIYISSYEFSRFWSALIGPLLKPLFSLGVAVGILGMSHQYGGVVRKIFEWKPAVFLGNITYSTYIVQFAIVFYRTTVATHPLYISDFILILSFIRDSTYSFICGFLMHVLLEIPALQLQNVLVPKIRTHQP